MCAFAPYAQHSQQREFMWKKDLIEFIFPNHTHEFNSWSILRWTWDPSATIKEAKTCTVMQLPQIKEREAMKALQWWRKSPFATETNCKELIRAMVWLENWSMLNRSVTKYSIFYWHQTWVRTIVPSPFHFLPGTIWMLKSNAKQCRQPHKGCLLQRNPQHNLFKTILNTPFMLFQYHFCIWYLVQSSESRCSQFQWWIQSGSIHPGCTSEY